MKFIITILSAALLLGFVPAHAQAVPGDPTPFVMSIERFAKKVNQPCAEREKSIFKVVVKVSPGTGGAFVNGEKGYGILMLSNGRPLVQSDYPVSTTDYQTNEFYWFGGRFATIDLESDFNIVVVEGVGRIMTFTVGKLRRICQGVHYGM